MKGKILFVLKKKKCFSYLKSQHHKSSKVRSFVTNISAKSPAIFKKALTCQSGSQNGLVISEKQFGGKKFSWNCSFQTASGALNYTKLQPRWCGCVELSPPVLYLEGWPCPCLWQHFCLQAQSSHTSLCGRTWWGTSGTKCFYNLLLGGDNKTQSSYTPLCCGTWWGTLGTKCSYTCLLLYC